MLKVVVYLLHTLGRKTVAVIHDMNAGHKFMLCSDSWSGTQPRLVELDYFELSDDVRVGPALRRQVLTAEFDGDTVRQTVSSGWIFTHSGPERGLIVVNDSNPEAYLNVQALVYDRGMFWASPLCPCDTYGRAESFTLLGNDLTVVRQPGKRFFRHASWALDLNGLADLGASETPEFVQLFTDTVDEMADDHLKPAYQLASVSA